MKTRVLLAITILCSASIAVLSLCSFGSGNSTLADDGQSNCVGSPGESGTCSRSGCHGAGNGNSTTGGLPDNGGPGSITYTTTPAMQFNNYIPGTTYTFNITVAENGKPRYGFACELLDNSGSTDGHINNTAGTIIVSDPIHTRTWQAFGSGRMDITHRTGVGFSSTGSYTYQFQWTAPASGIVNLYMAGNAVNNDMLPDAQDNVYTLYQQLFPAVTGIANAEHGMTVNLFPNPSNGNFNIKMQLEKQCDVRMQIVSMTGEVVRDNDLGIHHAGLNDESIDAQDLSPGVYFLRINAGDAVNTLRMIIR